jgi:NACalpha-BTF3-like transcription factor
MSVTHKLLNMENREEKNQANTTPSHDDGIGVITEQTPISKQDEQDSIQESGDDGDGDE